MNAIVIEHVPVAELPLAWQAKLVKATGTTVTIRIEEELPLATLKADDSLFGMWRDRDDMTDVAGYVRSIRASRFNEEGPSGNS